MLLHSSGSITRIFPNLLGHALRIIAPPRRALRLRDEHCASEASIAPQNLLATSLSLSSLSLARALSSRSLFSRARAIHWAARTYAPVHGEPTG